jgi:hypothetical protein
MIHKVKKREGGERERERGRVYQLTLSMLSAPFCLHLVVQALPGLGIVQFSAIRFVVVWFGTLNTNVR